MGRICSKPNQYLIILKVGFSETTCEPPYKMKLKDEDIVRLNWKQLR